jgi:hypothetical protein
MDVLHGNGPDWHVRFEPGKEDKAGIEDNDGRDEETDRRREPLPSGLDKEDTCSIRASRSVMARSACP